MDSSEQNQRESKEEYVDPKETKNIKIPKILLVGDIGTGKSSLLHALACGFLSPISMFKGMVSPKEFHFSTEGLEKNIAILTNKIDDKDNTLDNKHSLSCENSSENQQEVKIPIRHEELTDFKIIDTCGVDDNDSFNLSVCEQIKECDLVLYVMSATKTPIEIKKLLIVLTKISHEINEGHYIEIVVVVNKFDDIHDKDLNKAYQQISDKILPTTYKNKIFRISGHKFLISNIIKNKIILYVPKFLRKELQYILKNANVNVSKRIKDYLNQHNIIKHDMLEYSIELEERDNDDDNKSGDWDHFINYLSEFLSSVHKNIYNTLEKRLEKWRDECIDLHKRTVITLTINTTEDLQNIMENKKVIQIMYRDGIFYDGYITGINKNIIDVHFIDGTLWTTCFEPKKFKLYINYPMFTIRTIYDLKIIMENKLKIKAVFGNGQQFYEGIIASIDGDCVKFNYDDGDVRCIPFEPHKFKLVYSTNICDINELEYVMMNKIMIAVKYKSCDTFYKAYIVDVNKESKMIKIDYLDGDKDTTLFSPNKFKLIESNAYNRQTYETPIMKNIINKYNELHKLHKLLRINNISDDRPFNKIVSDTIAQILEIKNVTNFELIKMIYQYVCTEKSNESLVKHMYTTIIDNRIIDSYTKIFIFNFTAEHCPQLIQKYTQYWPVIFSNDIMYTSFNTKFYNIQSQSVCTINNTNMWVVRNVLKLDSIPKLLKMFIELSLMPLLHLEELINNNHIDKRSLIIFDNKLLIKLKYFLKNYKNLINNNSLTYHLFDLCKFKEIREYINTYDNMINNYSEYMG
jgi:predicted GTPase